MLIDKARPGGNYYDQSQGDFLLFLTRVDKIKYDILEQKEMKKKALMAAEIRKKAQEEQY